MKPGTDTTSARDQLAALAADAAPLGPFPADRGDLAAEDAREAAVLVLFGVLDGVPSTRVAQAPAVTPELDVLLLSRATTLTSHAGQVAFPGGRLDPDDDGLVAAALREAWEETGLDPTGVEILGTLGDVPIPASRFLVTPVLGWWARPTAVRVVDPAESDAVFRVPVADLLNPDARRTTVWRRDGRVWRGPGFLVPSEGRTHLVWGFTALILDALFTRLGWTEDWDRSRELDV